MYNPTEDQDDTSLSPATVHADHPVPTLHQLLDGAGNFTENWYTQFSDLQGSEKTLAKFKNPESLAKSYAELEKVRSYPGSEHPEKMAAFRKLAGLPDSPEEFSLSCPDGASKDAWDADMAHDLAQVAYETGVPPLALNALATRYMEHRKRADEAYENSIIEREATVEQTLKNEWGAEFDSTMKRTGAVIRRLAGKAGLDPEQVIDDPSIYANHALIKMMSEAAKLLDEPSLKTGAQPDSSPSDEARRIESDPSHPLHEAYMNHSHPNHKYANQVFDKLFFSGRK